MKLYYIIAEVCLHNMYSGQRHCGPSFESRGHHGGLMSFVTWPQQAISTEKALFIGKHNAMTPMIL